MPAVTIRNLSPEAHRAMKARAARHGSTTEAEMRSILEKTAHPEQRVRLGSALSQLTREEGVTNGDLECVEESFETNPATAASLT